ncbi:Rv1733c family protein [Streptomyces poriticola]|uniref:Rv1733c family protein n=1 Tax=Streptomyces poriticola TaxID=3120506 RepID=UPI002FCE5356
MRTRVRGWRWRRNPLRRRSDVVEAWTVLAVAVLLFLGAPLAGAASAWWAHGQAHQVASEQQTDRRQVRAEVVGRASDTASAVHAGGQHAYRATVRWTEPGGTERTTTVRVPTDTRRGDAVDVWLDPQGRSVPAPATSATVWQHTLTLGACGTAGTAFAVLLARGAVRRVALRHRLAEWERAWARTEPRWTHRRA